jgi:phage terminase large subunit
MFQATPLFTPNYDAVSDPSTQIIVNQGGTSSAKTYTILQVLFVIAISEPKSIITVAGQDIPNLKKGAMRDAETIVSNSPELQAHIKSHNKSDRIYTFHNGSKIEFSSFTNEQDAKSGKRDYLFCNEANGISYLVYWQLAIRTRKKVFIDYNPTAKFWVHEKLIGQGGTKLIISDHRHNPFLKEEEHAKIEGIDDKELFKVYARGLTGQVKGLIYPKYQLCDGIPSFVETSLGLDFGFNHKMALVECGLWENRNYWHELIYQSELTISDLIQLMKGLGIGRKHIYADSARPDAIEDLKRAGFNITPADKAVRDGIDFVKSRQLFITRESSGLRKEVQHYKWAEKNGVTLEEPVKFLDDGMDAGRYGSYTQRKGNSIKVIDSGGGSILDMM